MMVRKFNKDNLTDTLEEFAQNFCGLMRKIADDTLNELLRKMNAEKQHQRLIERFDLSD